MEKINFIIKARRQIGGNVKASNEFWKAFDSDPGQPGNPSMLMRAVPVYLKANTQGENKILVYSDKECTVAVARMTQDSPLSPEQLEGLKGYQSEVISRDNHEITISIDAAKDKTFTPTLNLAEKISKETGLTEESVKERFELLEYYGVPNSGRIFEEIAFKIARQPEGEEINRPDVLFVNNEKQNVIKQMLIAAAKGVNYCLEGAKSVGKNVAWETVGYLLNRKIFSVQCSYDMTAETVLGHVGTDNSRKVLTIPEIERYISNYEVLKSQGQGVAEAIAPIMESVISNLSPRLVINYGAAGRALQHENAGYGSILLLDEMNLSNPSSFTSLFNQITDRHSQYIEIDTERVPISRDLVIGGTQNSVGTEYSGTSKMNGAAMSRWAVLKVKAAKSILPVLKTSPSSEYLSEEELETLNKLYQAFRESAESGDISDSALNIRGFKAAVDLISCGISVGQAVIDCVVNTVYEEDEIEILSAQVEAIAGF